MQAVTAGAFDRQPVFLRADVNDFGFDAGQVDENDVFVREFADVDLGRPCAVARDVGEWQERLVNGLLDGQTVHLLGRCHDLLRRSHLWG